MATENSEEQLRVTEVDFEKKTVEIAVKDKDSNVAIVSQTVVAGSAVVKWALAPDKAPVVGRIPKYAYSLFEILSYRRESATRQQDEFCEKFLDTIPNMRSDHYGNRWLALDPSCPVIYACHVDTMHKSRFLPAPRKQILKYKDGFIQLDHDRAKGGKNTPSNCLGADDGAGIWLMMQMILAKVPGTYVFHLDEEIGRQGSIHMAEKYQEWAQSHKAVISFDRRGTKDIITHQMGARTASDAFARSLAEQLSYKGNDYAPCDGGSYTDSKSYAKLVSECTNVSVGYYDEHGPKEKLNLHHLINLRNRLVKLNPALLVFERDHTKDEYDDWYDRWQDDRWSKNNYHGSRRSSRWKSYESEYDDKRRSSSSRLADLHADGDVEEIEVDETEISIDTHEELYNMIIDNPDLVAEFLQMEGYTPSDIEDYMAHS